MSTDDTGREDLGAAERVLDVYGNQPLVSDEAELLRGCLYALVAIGRRLYRQDTDTEAPF